MRSRKDRLTHLLKVQRTVEGLHEMRVAAANAKAAAAEADVEALMRLAASGKLVDLFPDIYTRRIAAAHGRKAAASEAARLEADALARETLRTSMVARSAGIARMQEERQASEKEMLERATRPIGEDSEP